MLEKISHDLPNFPLNIIQNWLLPFANDLGWPPKHERWEKILITVELDYWRHIHWTKSEIKIEELNTSDNTELRIKRMREAYILKENNEFSEMVERGRERFHLQLHQLIEHGVFRDPLIFVKDGFKFTLIDGYHRLLAHREWKTLSKKRDFLSLLKKEYVAFMPHQLAWIGTSEPNITEQL